MVKSCPITEWSITWMPFEYPTKLSPVFRPPFEYCAGIQMVVWILRYHLNNRHLNTMQVKDNYSDIYFIQMFVIQIPTVVLDFHRIVKMTKKMTESDRAHSCKQKNSSNSDQILWFPKKISTVTSGFNKQFYNAVKICVPNRTGPFGRIRKAE